MNLPAHRYKDREPLLPNCPECGSEYDAGTGGCEHRGPLGADAFSGDVLIGVRGGTPLQRTQRRAHGSVSVWEPSSRAKTQPEGESTSTSNWAVDVDGVADAFPRVTQSLMSALMAAGHHVFVITGVDADAATAADRAAKVQYLTNLGIGPECYTDVIVCPQPHPENKAKAIQDNHIGVLLDNDKQNIKAAAPYCVALLLWNSKE